MSSGSLPADTYHRAQSLGEGTYGSVIAVFNEEGEEYALKLFFEDEEEEDDDHFIGGMDIGALREVSALRLIREKNGHSNIVPLVDIPPQWDEEEQEEGAGTSGCMSMAMPLCKSGTLGDMIDSKALQHNRKAKVAIAHGLLSAVAHLHDNGIMHRDIKADNVMLEPDSSCDKNTQDVWKPVLIDFSLAKLVNARMYGKQEDVFTWEEAEVTHTGGPVGTVTYMAPEVVNSEPYGQKCDLWSVGVILLEVLQNQTLQATKNSHAERLIQEAKETLPKQPFADLVRGLLAENPEERLSAREALASPLFAKFGHIVPPVRLIDVHTALPLELPDDQGEEAGAENEAPNQSNQSGKNKRHRSSKYDVLLQRRQRTLHKLCSELDCTHPMTRYAALIYSEQLYQLDDAMDDISSSQSLLDCVLVACKFFEAHVPDFHELEEASNGTWKNWSLDEFCDNEETLWMLMDHCLYPRSRMEYFK